MAEDLNDGEFWLPSQFLTDDDILIDLKDTKKEIGRKGLGTENEGGFNFLYGFSSNSFGHNSDLISPVESVVSSNETESDIEDYLAGLTEKLAQSTLHDHLWKAESGGLNCDNTKSFSFSGSPQSTLCDVFGRYGSKQGSSLGSPNYPSQASSPPAKNRNDTGAWNLFCKAADEVARMRMLEDASRFYQMRGLYGHQTCPVSVNMKNPNPELGFHSEQPISYQQFQANQFQRLRQQHMMKHNGSCSWERSKGNVSQYHQNQPLSMVHNTKRVECGRPPGLSISAWPTLQQSQQQQKSASGMRAVFLGNHGAKRECAGTGVFLPRRMGTITEARKKPAACSTVLLPERVVHALNLNLQSTDTLPRHETIPNPEYARNNSLMAQRRRNVRGKAIPVVNSELRLPQEWTY